MTDASTRISSSSSINYISSGASIAAAGFSKSTDIATGLLYSTNLARYPRADVALTLAPGSTTSSTALNLALYRRDLAIDGTNNEAPVDGGNTAHFCGNFLMPSTISTGTYYMEVNDVPLLGSGLSTGCEFHIQNNLTNTVPAGWKLSVTPKTDVGSTV